MKNMPSPEQILAGLAGIANDYTIIALLWHLLFLAVIIMLLLGTRPIKRYAGIFLSTPFISVGIMAILSGNPFNAVIFFVLTFILILYSLKFPLEKAEVKLNFPGIIGVGMIAFGWIYPHFLETTSPFKYLYASPMGLIPCPTLSLIIGFTLLFQGFSSRKWIIALAVMGLYYGLTGLIKLDVYLDAGLVIGALVLGISGFWKGFHAVRSS
jgi:hypothetical protein